MTQLSIPFNPKAKARRTDPETSHVAARMAGGLAEGHKQAIMDFLDGVAPLGASYEDISKATKIEKHAIGRRLKELRDAGRIQAAGETILSTGRPGQTWRARAV